MLTKFAHSELPYPRVRDANGWTTELADFLRSRYDWTRLGFLWLEGGRVQGVDWDSPVVFVGEAPAVGNSGRGVPLGPQTASGRRMEELLGCPLVNVGQPVNLFEVPGRWRPKAARLVAEAVVAEGLRRSVADLPVPRFVLLGRRVGAAFGGDSSTPWLAWHDVLGIPVALFPHPSGLSRWWNDHKNVLAAIKFLRALPRATDAR